MAMLAEKRKRIKYCLNPNGNLWNNDGNKFGQKLLEKLGWKKGQGLGANNQGITERLKVSFKFDTSGLGFKEKDTSLQQQNAFQNLLHQLNDEKLENVSEPMVSSLEEKSKKSKSRVHYHKFTRGKDISQYSKKDLSCILGTGYENNSVQRECDSEYNGNLVYGGSINEYFDKKQFNSSTIDNKIKFDDEFDNRSVKCNDTEERICSIKEENNYVNGTFENKLPISEHVKRKKRTHKEILHAEREELEQELSQMEPGKSEPLVFNSKKHKKKKYACDENAETFKYLIENSIKGMEEESYINTSFKKKKKKQYNDLLDEKKDKNEEDNVAAMDLETVQKNDIKNLDLLPNRKKKQSLEKSINEGLYNVYSNKESALVSDCIDQSKPVLDIITKSLRENKTPSECFESVSSHKHKKQRSSKTGKYNEKCFNHKLIDTKCSDIDGMDSIKESNNQTDVTSQYICDNKIDHEINQNKVIKNGSNSEYCKKSKERLLVNEEKSDLVLSKENVNVVSTSCSNNNFSQPKKKKKLAILTEGDDKIIKGDCYKDQKINFNSNDNINELDSGSQTTSKKKQNIISDKQNFSETKKQQQNDLEKDCTSYLEGYVKSENEKRGLNKGDNAKNCGNKNNKSILDINLSKHNSILMKKIMNREFKKNAIPEYGAFVGSNLISVKGYGKFKNK